LEWQHGKAQEGIEGGRVMAFLLSDVLLFFFLTAWVTGLVIAIASLLT
jgi:hypothetical protein